MTSDGVSVDSTPTDGWWFPGRVLGLARNIEKTTAQAGVMVTRMMGSVHGPGRVENTHMCVVYYIGL